MTILAGTAARFAIVGGRLDPVTTLRWCMAAAALVAAGYHLWHAARAWRSERAGMDTDLTHAAMGIGMAAMLTFDLGIVTTVGLITTFAIATLWYVVRAVDVFVDGGARPAGAAVRQLLCCMAMTGMLAVSLMVGGHSMTDGHTAQATAAAATHGGHAGMGAAKAMTGIATLDPQALVLGLLLIQLIVVAWTARSLVLRPTTHVGAQIAIGVSGVTMLALMLG